MTAKTLNEAGIIGAAFYAEEQQEAGCTPCCVVEHEIVCAATNLDDCADKAQKPNCACSDASK